VIDTSRLVSGNPCQISRGFLIVAVPVVAASDLQLISIAARFAD
jgi:hypothetical protein